MVSSSVIINRIRATIPTKNEEPIHLHEPFLKDSNAYEYIKECIDSSWVSSSGKWVSKFENHIASFTRSNLISYGVFDI